MKQACWMSFAVALLAISAAALAAAPATSAAPTAEDARLTAFLDGEFAQELQLRPQLATRLGSTEGADRLDDISDAGQLKRLEWRRASVARMKAQFDRAKLSAEAQVNYDIWALELDRAELSYKYRVYAPPFYSFLNSVHSELPEFLVNTHSVQSAADARSYAARVRAIPAALDGAHQKARAEGREAAEQRDGRIARRKERPADLCGEEAEDQEIVDFEDLPEGAGQHGAPDGLLLFTNVRTFRREPIDRFRHRTATPGCTHRSRICHFALCRKNGPNCAIAEAMIGLGVHNRCLRPRARQYSFDLARHCRQRHRADLLM